MTTLLLLFILTANGFLPGGSSTTIRYNIQITRITQNNTMIKRNTAHNKGHTTQNAYNESQLQLYFTVSDSRLPQTIGPGPSIYISLPGTGWRRSVSCEVRTEFLYIFVFRVVLTINSVCVPKQQ
jgi:hypothetical protein